MAFPTLRTNSGNLCLIYTKQAGGLYPIHGAYLIKNGENNEWLPCFWTAEGYRISQIKPSGLDITKALHEKAHTLSEPEIIP